MPTTLKPMYNIEKPHQIQHKAVINEMLVLINLVAMAETAAVAVGKT